MNYERVEAIRNSLFMTREGFAKLLGVPLSTVYAWSRPGRSPRGGMVTLLRLLEMFPGEKASLLVKLNKKVEAEKEKI
jgi:DNA-binding transcriptional regulator YiaG